MTPLPLSSLILIIIDLLVVTLERKAVARLTLRYPANELARMAELFFPEERRHDFTAEPWDGVSFRHYRDPRVTCLEHYMPRNKSILPDALLKPRRKPAA